MYQANNYGFNPYGTYIPQRPMQPTQQQMVPTQISLPINNTLNGKQVDSIDVVKATDIPLDGSISYFPLTDGSAIVSKQLGMDGTSKIVVYKQAIEEEKEQIKYITEEDMKKAINSIDLSDLEDLKDEIKDLKSEIKDLKKKKKED